MQVSLSGFNFKLCQGRSRVIFTTRIIHSHLYGLIHLQSLINVPSDQQGLATLIKTSCSAWVLGTTQLHFSLVIFPNCMNLYSTHAYLKMRKDSRTPLCRFLESVSLPHSLRTQPCVTQRVSDSSRNTLTGTRNTLPW